MYTSAHFSCLKDQLTYLAFSMHISAHPSRLTPQHHSVGLFEIHVFMILKLLMGLENFFIDDTLFRPSSVYCCLHCKYFIVAFVLSKLKYGIALEETNT